ncbi:TVP38/TMEM64 family protein [Demequina aurantiaca]|uniref:TVP38/TMEM64 family protein n=1 Tax=Demequina aurantiaca TaxID=676200 RepID=UPI003D327216
MQLSNRAVVWRAAIFVAFLVGVVLIAVLAPLPSVDSLLKSVSDAGVWGAVLFVLGYGLATLTPIPKSVVSIAAGFTWGLALGVALVYVGALIGAALAFAIGRSLGRDAVERFTGARVAKVDEAIRQKGLVALIGVRLVPVFPFTVINYSAGLTDVRRRDYALGTMVGILPGTIAYVAVGAYSTTLGLPLYVAIGALLLLTAGGAVYAVRARRRQARNLLLQETT